MVATKAAGPSGQMTWIRGGPHKVIYEQLHHTVGCWPHAAIAAHAIARHTQTCNARLFVGASCTVSFVTATVIISLACGPINSSGGCSKHQEGT